jgi:uncharacterized protein YbjQ (UPF0145 family)
MEFVTTETVPGHEIDESLERMAEDAESMGADAVVNVRMESSAIANGGSEVIAYGTAVTLE